MFLSQMLYIMSLLWLLVSDCEQRGCIHLLHIMSLWWLRVSDCGQAEGGLLAMHRESNEAGGIRLRTTGLFHRLHIMSLLWLQVCVCEQGV
ncbi:hypothetical protein BME66_07890 [Klebsiella pneumoniae]|nr:hypothetical protein BME66_07890 [Klebsiella pneumoniae]